MHQIKQITGLFLVFLLILTPVSSALANECTDKVKPAYSLNYEGDPPGAELKVHSIVPSSRKWLSGFDKLSTEGDNTGNRKGGFVGVYSKAFIGARMEESLLKVKADVMPPAGCSGGYTLKVKLRYYASAGSLQVLGCKGQLRFVWGVDNETHSFSIEGPSDAEWFLEQLFSLASLVGGQVQGLGTAFDILGATKDVVQIGSNLHEAVQEGKAETYTFTHHIDNLTEGTHTFRFGFKTDTRGNGLGTGWAYGFGQIYSISLTPDVCPEQSGGSGGGGGGGADRQMIR